MTTEKITPHVAQKLKVGDAVREKVWMGQFPRGSILYVTEATSDHIGVALSRGDLKGSLYTLAADVADELELIPA